VKNFKEMEETMQIWSRAKLRAMRDYWQRKRPSAMPPEIGLIEFENSL